MAEASSVVDLADARATHQDAAASLSASTLEHALVNIDPQIRDALNVWLTRRAAPVFLIAQQEFEIRWVHSAAERWHVLLELAVGEHRALLALDGFAALDPLLVGEPFTLMPPALRSLAVQRLAARILTFAPQALVNALEVRSVHWDGRGVPNWPCRLPFVLRQRSDGTQITGTLLFENALGLQWLHATLPVDQSSSAARLSVPALLRMNIGRSSIPSASLYGLAAGDVVWIQSAGITRAGIAVELVAASARYTWRSRVHRASLRIESAAAFKPGSPSQPSFPFHPSATAGEGADSMDPQRWQLEVPVAFDLGEVQLQIADLERLQPGHVLELAQDVATATVTLRVGDRRIAEGTLISVGKRLGVRISSVYARREAGSA